MPFIEQWRRDVLTRYNNDLSALGEVHPGDRCYVFYKKMVEQWKASPRWTTAHMIAREMFEGEIRDPEADTALFLAFLVFFNTHVMPYELKKREENGDI